MTTKIPQWTFAPKTSSKVTPLSKTLHRILGPKVRSLTWMKALKRLYAHLNNLPSNEEVIPGANAMAVNQLVQGIDYASNRISSEAYHVLRKMDGSQICNLIGRLWEDRARTIADVGPRLNKWLAPYPKAQMPLLNQ